MSDPFTDEDRKVMARQGCSCSLCDPVPETIRSAIRLERAKITKQEQAAEERLAAIRGKIEALDAAEAALAGETPSANGDKPKRTRTFKGRKSREERKNETLDALREVEPRLLADEGRSAGDLAADFGIPHASAANAIVELLDEGKVRKVGETSRGNPIVRYLVRSRFRSGASL